MRTQTNRRESLQAKLNKCAIREQPTYYIQKISESSGIFTCCSVVPNAEDAAAVLLVQQRKNPY
jgi:hypothetical protein